MTEDNIWQQDEVERIFEAYQKIDESAYKELVDFQNSSEGKYTIAKALFMALRVVDSMDGKYAETHKEIRDDLRRIQSLYFPHAAVVYFEDWVKPYHETVVTVHTEKTEKDAKEMLRHMASAVGDVIPKELFDTLMKDAADDDLPSD